MQMESNLQRALCERNPEFSSRPFLGLSTSRFHGLDYSLWRHGFLMISVDLNKQSERRSGGRKIWILCAICEHVDSATDAGINIGQVAPFFGELRSVHDNGGRIGYGRLVSHTLPEDCI